MANQTQLDGFVTAVHRRMLLLRAVERLGLCLLGGCVLLFVLMPILIWRSQATAQLTLVTLGTALVAGIAWALTSRPSRLAAAMEADRQLKLHDLLGTALLLQQGGSLDEIERTVISQAEASCSQFSPATVVLHRLGARGWGGIGLAATLVGGLYLLGPDTSRAEARASTSPKSWQETELENEKANATHLLETPDMRRQREGGGTDEDPPKPDGSNADESTAGNTATNTNQAAHNDVGASQEGTGAGAAQSASKTNPAKTTDTASGNSRMNPQGTDTAGGGGASTENGNTTGKSGNTAAAVKSHKPAPIWQSQSWPADQESARSAIRSGQIPDAYRELVRDYFERE
jgi:hypothetical protein